MRGCAKAGNMKGEVFSIRKKACLTTETGSLNSEFEMTIRHHRDMNIHDEIAWKGLWVSLNGQKFLKMGFTLSFC